MASVGEVKTGIALAIDRITAVQSMLATAREDAQTARAMVRIAHEGSVQDYGPGASRMLGETDRLCEEAIATTVAATELLERLMGTL